MKRAYLLILSTLFLFVVGKERKIMAESTLHPDYPVVEGEYQMTKEWSIYLPGRFNRRFEEGELVIWKPGFTLWIVVWRNDKGETIQQRLEWLKRGTSRLAFNAEEIIEPGVSRYAYRLSESSDDERRPAFYCFAIGGVGHVQVAAYFDVEEDAALAKSIWKSLTIRE